MSENKITHESLIAAASLAGLEFTEAEREMMLPVLEGRLAQFDAMRRVTLENSTLPPLHFDPRTTHPAPPEMPRYYHQSPVPTLERPSNLEDVAFYPVTHLAELVRTRQVTSIELTEMYLQRLKTYNPHLECVVTFTDDLAMAQARQADEEIAAGQYRGPLHGIPWGAKDLFATRGYKTTWGATPYKDQMIDLDATVIERLREAGAVLVAKLTMGALAYGDIWFDGVTKNPWDITEGSSGSSAGPGSATAAGLVGFSIGTETLGSIVSPSSRCGVTGLRPTFGRVSRYGAMAVSWSMDKIGPMCRTVEDCGLVFSAIYGPDGRDVSVPNIPFEWHPTRDVKTLRVGYVKSAFEAAAREESDSEKVLQALETMEGINRANSGPVLDVLRQQLGLELIPIELPDYELEPLFMILVAEAAAEFDELTRSNRDDLLKWQAPQAFPNLFRAARLIPAVEYIQANRIRTLVMQEMAAIMQEVDVFVVPSFGGNALTLTNLTGHPAVAVPNGFSHKDTPTSITFIGGLYKEAETLTVAKAYQDATTHHLRHPAMHY